MLSVAVMQGKTSYLFYFTVLCQYRLQSVNMSIADHVSNGFFLDFLIFYE